MNTNVTSNKFVNGWIAEMAEMVNPASIVLIDGSEEQAEALRKRLKLADGGDNYLFATTLADNRKVIVVGEKIQ